MSELSCINIGDYNIPITRIKRDDLTEIKKLLGT